MTTTLHFSIDFKWLTDHVRQLWSEGRYQLALDTLCDSGCPEGYHKAILRGTIKMAGINEGYIEKDNWKPDLSICHRGTYPDPDRLPVIAQQGEEYREKYFDMLEMEYNSLVYEWGRTTNGPKLSDLAYTVCTTFPEEFIETLSEDQKRMWKLAHREASSPTLLLDTSLIIGLDEFVERERKLDEAETPEPDDDYQSRHGWILPNGDFYPCEYWAHDWLADCLGRTVIEAEDRGWVRVGHSCIDGKARIARGKNFNGLHPQPQLDATWTWCQLHNVELPRWITEE